MMHHPCMILPPCQCTPGTKQSNMCRHAVQAQPLHVGRPTHTCLQTQPSRPTHQHANQNCRMSNTSKQVKCICTYGTLQLPVCRRNHVGLVLLQPAPCQLGREQTPTTAAASIQLHSHSCCHHRSVTAFCWRNKGRSGHHCWCSPLLHHCCYCCFIPAAYDSTSMNAMIVIATSVINTMHASVMGPTLSSKKPTCTVSAETATQAGVNVWLSPWWVDVNRPATGAVGEAVLREATSTDG